MFTRPTVVEKKPGLIARFLAACWRFLVFLLALAGFAAVLAVALAFTPVPWQAYQWLSQDSFKLDGQPDCIVILGGGGIPSETGLMRCYFGALASREFSRSWLIVALPAEEEAEGLTSPEKMKAELVLRGVPADMIKTETKGRNTREQALRIAKMLGEKHAERPVVLVTSPDHMKRALLAFRKAGIDRVEGRAAMAESVAADLSYAAPDLGGDYRAPLDVGDSMMLRYQFWNNLGYLAAAAHEGAALGYYWLRGWI